MRKLRARAADDQGAAPVEFVLVGTLLTALTLAVLQLALAIYVRNVVHDAAVEGAHYAALADVGRDAGRARTAEVITRAVGASYADDITVGHSTALGHDTVTVKVRTAVPIVGLIGIPAAWEVTAHAPMEDLGE